MREVVLALRLVSGVMVVRAVSGFVTVSAIAVVVEVVLMMIDRLGTSFKMTVQSWAKVLFNIVLNGSLYIHIPYIQQ